MKLVNSHKTKPNFSKTSLSGNLGETIVLEDKNKVLSYFDVSDSNNNPVKKEGNKLYITLKNPGTSKIKLKKARYDSKATIVYSTTKGVGQKVAILRASDEVEMEMNLEVKAKLKIVKVDKDTNEVIKKAGFKFKLKDLKTNEYVCENTSCTFETNTDGEVTTKSLLSGEYELEEVDELMEPYTWNKEKVKIKIDSNSEIVDNVIVFKYANKRVSGKIVIKKFGENLTLKDNDFTYEEIPLKDVKYELYAKDDIYFNNELKYKKDTLVSNLITNEKGEGVLENLYLGSYYLIETESSNGHIVDKEKHYFELTYEDQYKEIIEKDFDFKNYLPKGKLEFLKIDSKTGKPLSNTLIEIHLKGEEDKIIYKGETDKNGKIVLNDLPLGDYYIKEVKSREGYYLTDEIINFSIKEDTEVITLKMENTPIEEIEVPKTGIDNPWFSSLFTASLATFSLPTIYLFRKKLLEK